MKPGLKLKPAGKPMFAIGTSQGLLEYAEGEHEGMLVAFDSRSAAEEFIRTNKDKGDHFVVDLTHAGGQS